MAGEGSRRPAHARSAPRAGAVGSRRGVGEEKGRGRGRHGCRGKQHEFVLRGSGQGGGDRPAAADLMRPCSRASTSASAPTMSPSSPPLRP